MRTVHLSIFSLFYVFFVGSAVSFAEEARTWKDSTGRFSVEATLVEFNGTIAKIKRADGKSVSLPYSKLSKADQEYLDQWQGDNPFLAEDEQTSSTSADSASSSKTSGQQNTLAFTKKVVNISLEGIEEAGNFGDTQWNCDPDPAPVLEKKTFRRVGFRKPQLPISIFARNSDCFIDSNKGTTALCVYHVDASHGFDKSVTSFSRVYLGDLSTGKTTYCDSPDKLVPWGLSPQGDKAIFASSAWSGASFGTQDVLYVVEIKNGNFMPLVAYRPFADFAKERRMHNTDIDIKWAAWVDQKHVLVLSGGKNNLVLLNIDSGKPTWQAKTTFLAKIVLSPNGRYCLVPTGRNNVTLMETVTGKTIGHLDGLTPEMKMDSFAFSPDGTRLAAFNQEKLLLWNATTGQLEEPHSVPGLLRGSSVNWLDNQFLLARGKLIDAKDHKLVWEYQGLGDNVIPRGETCWVSFTDFNDGISLVPLKLPHPKAKQRIAKGIKDVAPVVYSGMNISLQLDKSVKDDRGKIKEALEKKLMDNGLKIVENASVTLVAKESEEEPVKTTYVTQNRMFPRPPLLFARGPQTVVETTPRKYQVSFMQKSEVLWEDSYTTKEPSDIVPEELGETSIEDKVKEYMKNQTFLKWLETLHFPAKIYASSGEIDMSLVSQGGISDMTPKQIKAFRQRESQMEAQLNRLRP